MAAARSSQAHQKRVQKIAEDAASAIAADSPVEEEVVVVVEESPPGASTPRRSRGAQVASNGVEGMADAISRWIGMPSTLGGSLRSLDPWIEQFDPRRLTEESFRFAEELLASQKQFALRLADVMTPTASV